MMAKTSIKTTRKIGMTSLITGSIMLFCGVAQAKENNVNNTNKDRAAIITKDSNGCLINFRRLPSDGTLRFDVFNGAKKLNNSSIIGQTNYKFDGNCDFKSISIKIDNGNGKKETITKFITINDYLEIKLNKPKDGIDPEGVAYSYTANDASLGDLDGDGTPEIILKWDPTNSKDNAFSGYTGNVYIDAYKLDGKQLWRIDLGKNIRAGAHYTQFMVADFDNDNKAEIIIKTADGTIDGIGKTIGNPNANWVNGGHPVPTNDRTGSTQNPDGSLSANLKGRILSGPEYLTLFDGTSGKAIDTIDYAPKRGITTDNPTSEEMKAIWGDGYGNRSERYLGGIAYFDAKPNSPPSVIMARGYYARTTIAAFDVKNKKLVKRFLFDSGAKDATEHSSGQGNHQMSIADINNDGKQEIIYGAMAVDGNGKVLWSSNLRHGDALHVGDFDLDNPGLERYGVHEDMSNGNIGAALLDAKTGKILVAKHAEKDTGRGVAADIDPRHKGAEMWAASSNELWNAKGEKISGTKPNSTNFVIYWDGDLLSELLDKNQISKWDWETGTTKTLMTATGTTSNNGTKATPALTADFLGDWREELILRTEDNSALRIYSTNIPTQYSIPYLLSDKQYKAAIAWQNTAYNQPPHLSYDLKSKYETK